MIITAFTRTWDNRPKTLDLDVGDLVRFLTTPAPDDGRVKEDHAMWSPATYPPGTRRSKRAALGVSALVADVDDGTPIPEAIERVRRATDALVVVHTSYSHRPPGPDGPDHPKYRVVLPTATPIPAIDFPRAWAWLAGVLRCLDPVTHDVCRCYFVPVDRPGFEAHVLEGPLLDLPWSTLPLPVRRTPLRLPTGELAPPTWRPSPTVYPLATIEAAVTAWRAHVALAAAALACTTDSRRTAALTTTYPLARYGWLHPGLDAELRAAIRDATAENGRHDANIDTLIEDCMRDATGDPGPIEDLVPDAEGVAPPIVAKYRSGYWVLGLDGLYAGPVDAKGIIPYLRARGDVPYHSASGAPWSADRILDAYGTNVEAIEMVWPDERGTIPRPWEPATRTLRATRARRRVVAPVYHEEVALWVLALLEGVRPDIASAMLDWLATVGRLDVPTSALYIEGPRGVGKGLLAGALAAPWGAKAVPLGVALGKFPIALAGCPIVVLNEGTSMDAAATAAFRDLVGERSHDLDEKHLPRVPLVGAPRVLVTANNPDALGIRELRSLDDLDAIVDRVLHVPVGGAARAYLEGLGPDGTVGWVTRADGSPGLVPEYLAWLATTRTVEGGARWVVPGIRTPWHEALLWRVPDFAAVLQGVISGLVQRPTPAWTWDGEGHVEVRAKALHERWSFLVLEDAIRPALSRLVRVLEGLAVAEGTGGTWRVDGHIVRSYARTIGVDLPARPGA